MGASQFQLNTWPVVQNARSLDADNPQANSPTNQPSRGMRPTFAIACSNTLLPLNIVELWRTATTPARTTVLLQVMSAMGRKLPLRR